jgi:hypothetical protein
MKLTLFNVSGMILLVLLSCKTDYRGEYFSKYNKSTYLLLDKDNFFTFQKRDTIASSFDNLISRSLLEGAYKIKGDSLIQLKTNKTTRYLLIINNNMLVVKDIPDFIDGDTLYRCPPFHDSILSK